MRAPSPAKLIEAWERAMTCPVLGRAAALLGAIDDLSIPQQEWERAPLGQRDAAILALRQAIFGSQMDCLTQCPSCDSELEFSMSADQLHLPATREQSMSLAAHGMQISFRLPNTADLLGAGAEIDAASIRKQIFAQCVLSATDDSGAVLSPQEIPDELVDLVSRRMAEADPQADLSFALRCPACRHAWEAPFDLAAFFWQELHSWAKRLLMDVHDLAGAYGWSESEILALSAVRREAYLNLVRS